MIPEGQWKLTGGTGESFYGEGTGQSYAINGTFDSNGTTRVFGEESQTWTINGKIKENGFQNFTGGETTHYDVADNDWNETSSVPTGIESAGYDYSNTATGNYTRAGIEGDMDRSFVIKQRSDRTTEDGGSGTTGSGTDFYLATTNNSYNYSGEYTEDDGHNITIEESGTTNNKYEENEEYELDSNDNFFQTSGTITKNDFNEESAEITSKAVWVEDKATNDNRVTEDDGSWRSRIGSDSLTGNESKSSKFDSKKVYSSTIKKYEVTEQTSTSEEDYLLITKYDTKGSYYDVLPDGTATGTYKASGDSEHTFTANSDDTLVFGIIPVSKGTGKSKGNSEANYEYTDKGTLKVGTLSGTTSHSGKSHAESDYDKQLKYRADGWYAKGTGNSSASGESHSTYTGTGKYKEKVDGEKLKGTHTASGKHNESYDGNAKFSVGPAGSWVLTSGTSESSYDGDEKYSKDLSGKYKVQFGPNSEAILKGTVNLDTNFEMDYSGSYDATVVQNQWATTGKGDSTTITSYNLDYDGSGRNLKTAPYDEGEPGVTGFDHYYVYSSESGENHKDTVYKYDWELTAAGESTDTHLEVKSSAEGKYTYRLKEALKRKTVDGDYDDGNGSISIVKESTKGVAKEQFKWDQTVNVYEDTDASGNATIWGNTTGKSEGKGKSTDKFKDHEYFRSKFTSPELVTTMISNSGGSGSGEDFYKYTGTWNETISKTSGTQFKVNYNNQVNGESTRNTYASWTSTTTVITEDSAGNTTEETTTDSDDFTDPSTDTSYNTTNSGNSFYSLNNNTWTQSGGFGTWAVMAPHTGNSTTSTQGTVTGTAPTGSTTSPSTTNPLAGGPWFKAGTFTVISVLTDHSNMMEAGLTEPTGFEKVRDNSVAIELSNHSDYHSTYYFVPGWVNEAIGETLRGFTGDEMLANAMDFQLFAGVALFSTAVAFGGYALLSAAPAWVGPSMLTAAGYGSLIGATTNVARYTADTWDAGESITFEGARDAGISGGITGAIAGAFLGPIGKAGGIYLPEVVMCNAKTILSSAFIYRSLSAGANDLDEGNNWSAGLNFATAGLTAIASFFGGCFVVETQIVMATSRIVTEIPPDQKDAKQSSSLGVTTVFVAGLGMIAISAIPKRRKKSKFEQASDEFFSDHWEIEDNLPHENIWDEPDELSFTESEDWDDLVTLAALEQSQPVSENSNTALLAAPPVRKKQIPYQPKPKEKFEISSKAKESKPSFLKSLGLITGIALMLLAGPLLFDSDNPTLPPDIAENTTQAPVTKSIQNVSLGDWVKAHNPELTGAERLPGIEISDPGNLRIVTMQMVKDDGTLLDMEFLRSVEWLEEHDAYIDGQIDLELSELGTTGIADVRLIEPCPVIMPRPGPDAQLVTGLFIHEAANAMDLQIIDQTGKVIETIGVTVNHPFWSEDRQEFVEAGQLRPGEQLLSAYEESIFVGSIETRAGPEPVFNLEINLEHVYYVTSTGVLAHNMCDTAKTGKTATPASKVKGPSVKAPVKTTWTSKDRSNAWKAKGRSSGKPPQRRVLVKNKKTGETKEITESKELHHNIPRRDNGSNHPNNLKEVWPTEHQATDSYRHTGYEIIKILEYLN